MRVSISEFGPWTPRLLEDWEGDFHASAPRIHDNWLRPIPLTDRNRKYKSFHQLALLVPVTHHYKHNFKTDQPDLLESHHSSSSLPTLTQRYTSLLRMLVHAFGLVLTLSPCCEEEAVVLSV